MAKRQTIEPIIFTKEDDQGVQFSHNDGVVITLNIENYNIRHIFIYNKNSATILYYDAFVKLEISPDQLGRVDFLLVSFTGDTIKVEEVVTLLVRLGHYPHRFIIHVDFLMIQEPLAYDTIFK